MKGQNVIYIIQATINDERYHKVNDKGWEGVEWGSAYLKTTTDPSEKSVLEALEHGLYEHTHSVHTDDLDAAFAASNGLGLMIEDDVEDLEHFEDHKSASVGDIFVEDDGSMSVVARFGFTEITDETIKMKVGEIVNGT